jgi:hypothetical protein
MVVMVIVVPDTVRMELSLTPIHKIRIAVSITDTHKGSITRITPLRRLHTAAGLGKRLAPAKAAAVISNSGTPLKVT